MDSYEWTDADGQRCRAQRVGNDVIGELWVSWHSAPHWSDDESGYFATEVLRLAERVKELEAKVDAAQKATIQAAMDRIREVSALQDRVRELEERLAQAEHVPGRVLAAVREGAEAHCAERIAALEAENAELRKAVSAFVPLPEDHRVLYVSVDPSKAIDPNG